MTMLTLFPVTVGEVIITSEKGESRQIPYPVPLPPPCLGPTSPLGRPYILRWPQDWGTTFVLGGERTALGREALAGLDMPSLTCPDTGLGLLGGGALHHLHSVLHYHCHLGVPCAGCPFHWGGAWRNRP